LCVDVNVKEGDVGSAINEKPEEESTDTSRGGERFKKRNQKWTCTGREKNREAMPEDTNRGIILWEASQEGLGGTKKSVAQ